MAEKRMTGKRMQLANKMNAIVDKNKHLVLEKSKEYCTYTMYIICSYIYLCRNFGHDAAIERLLEDNTQDYIASCINKVENLKNLVENKEFSKIEKILLDMASAYTSKYARAKKDFDLIIVVACVDGYDFEEFKV